MYTTYSADISTDRIMSGVIQSYAFVVADLTVAKIKQLANVNWDFDAVPHLVYKHAWEACRTIGMPKGVPDGSSSTELNENLSLAHLLT